MPRTREYVDLVPVLPFYRIVFDDGSHFDYDGDPRAHARADRRDRAGRTCAGYHRFHAAAKRIFDRGFLGLGYTYFGDVLSMLRIVTRSRAPGRDAAALPIRREARPQNDKLRAVFSFEPLLVGGNPLRVPAIYAMIHFVEKTWGVHFAVGGTGALVRAFVRKFEELGGTMRYDADAARIEVEPARRARPRVTGVDVTRRDPAPRPTSSSPMPTGRPRIA